jgi:hypothetical protein
MKRPQNMLPLLSAISLVRDYNPFSLLRVGELPPLIIGGIICK